MGSHQAIGNKSYGSSIQFNGPVNVNGPTAPNLQPSFLCPPRYEEQKDINPRRKPETCEWFLQHSIFTEWKDSNRDDILWLSADPGCGKSVLSRALIDEGLASGEQSATLCYFFFKDNENQNKVAIALRAILHQFFCTHENLLEDYCAGANRKFGAGLLDDVDELWKILTAVARDPSVGDVVCVLDALDECEESDRKKIVSRLEDFYIHSSKDSRHVSKLKFLVTSRPYGEIETSFFKLVHKRRAIRLAGEEESETISKEINIVTRARVDEIADEQEFDANLRSFLHQRLSLVTNKTYLWMYLVLEELEKRIIAGISEKRIRKVIDTLPNTVEEAYEKMLGKCSENTVARKALSIIVAARRPLTVREIDVALEIEQDSTCFDDLDCLEEGREKSLRVCCGLFIGIQDSRVYLIHQTAKEFLVRDNNETYEPGKWKNSITIEEANRVLSRICITRLLFPELRNYKGSESYQEAIKKFVFNSQIDSSKDVIQEEFHLQEFIVYSAEYWTSHLQRAGAPSFEWIRKALELCNFPDAALCPWLIIHSLSFGMRSLNRRKLSILEWTTLLGLVHETEYLLKEKPNSFIGDGDLQAAFELAPKTHGSMVRIMDLFLKQPRGSIEITEWIILKTIHRSGTSYGMIEEEVIAPILLRQAHPSEITERVMCEALLFEIFPTDSDELIKLSLSKTTVTKDIIYGMVCYLRPEIVSFGLQQAQYEVEITATTFRGATYNCKYGTDMFEFLLKLPGCNVGITNTLIEEIMAGGCCDYEQVGVLLKDPRCDVIITSRIITDVYNNEFDSRDIMKALLQTEGNGVRVSKWSLLQIMEKFGAEMIWPIVQRRGQMLYCTKEMVEILLQKISSRQLEPDDELSGEYYGEVWRIVMSLSTEGDPPVPVDYYTTDDSE